MADNRAPRAQPTRKARADLDALAAAGASGPVTIDGRAKLAWHGTLVNAATYAALAEAGA
jgi:hypothetical protein